MKNIFGNAAEIASIMPAEERFTLVGGCFDLIHVGHLHLFEYAASLEKVLIVAVLSDEYIKSYKNRYPVINQKQRVRMVASIRCVDFAYISDVSPSSQETLRMLKPHSVVFGEDVRNAVKMPQRIANIKNASPQTQIKFLPRYAEERVSTIGIMRRVREMEL